MGACPSPPTGCVGPSVVAVHPIPLHQKHVHTCGDGHVFRHEGAGMDADAAHAGASKPVQKEEEVEEAPTKGKGSR